MLTPLTWRALYLGTSTLTFADSPLALELLDGGGYVPSVAIWRVAGRVARIDEAARC